VRRLGLLALLLLAVPGTASGAADPAPWRAAEDVQAAGLDAQTGLIVGSAADAQRAARRAAQAYRGLSPVLHAADPSADATARRSLRAATRAAGAGEDARLAAARGAARAAIYRGAYAVVLEAVRRGHVPMARAWLLVREFRPATRFSRPGADATRALTRLRAGRLSRAAARAAVTKDLLDAYQARLRDLLADAARGQARGLPVRRAEAGAQAAGYFAILAPRYRQDRGAAALRSARSAFAHLATPGRGRFDAALAAARSSLEGFTAAPLTPEESARRAQQLLRFLALVPVEYGRGVSEDRVTKDFEIQEASAFQTGAAQAFADLEDALGRGAPAETRRARRDLARLAGLVQAAVDRPRGVPAHGAVERVAGRAQDELESAMPAVWKKQTDESDYDLIALTLDRMQAAAGAGQYRQAEQARLEAYAFFEFGPERRLKAFDQGLALDVEGLIWFGAHGTDGLATLIGRRAPGREIRETRRALDVKLADAAATLGDSANRTTVITNSAIIVFREGLEAVLILAAITASFVGVRRRLRRPVLIGAVLGLLFSVVTWVLAQTLLRSLQSYGEKLEAVVGLIAIGVLLLITNWFFHRVYWSEWLGRFHRQRKRLERAGRWGFLSAQVIGLAVLGLTSVYREGFETVLFLQSLELSAGTATVLEGAGLGLVMTLAVAVVTFALQRKLPYKKMLIVTGVLIGFVLVVMVGQTARTMQGTGWLSISPVGGEFPFWLELWFGVHPTWETLGAQVLAALFVIGSYFVAQEVRVKRPRRRARRAPTALVDPGVMAEREVAGPAPARSERVPS
jgi:high-affinity iron transporter